MQSGLIAFINVDILQSNFSGGGVGQIEREKEETYRYICGSELRITMKRGHERQFNFILNANIIIYINSIHIYK